MLTKLPFFMCLISMPREIHFEAPSVPLKIFATNLNLERHTLTKGEIIPLQYEFMNGNGPGNVNTAVQYLGKTVEEGTWVDQISKNDLPQDNYKYQKNILKFQQDSTRDVTEILMKFDEDLVESGTGLAEGETFSSDKRAQFRLKFCWDENECFTTTDLR